MGHEAKLTAEPADFGRLPGFSKEIPLLSTAIRLENHTILHGSCMVLHMPLLLPVPGFGQSMLCGGSKEASRPSLQRPAECFARSTPAQGMVDVEPVVKSSSSSFI